MKFKPKINRVLDCLQKGEVPLGMQIYSGDPTMIEIIAYAGFDYYMLDMEHSRVNFETMEHCIRAADAAGITTIVRVPENIPYLIRQAMEAGAQGIIVPHVNTREDVVKARDAMRYPPEGKAGICPAIRASYFSTEAWDDYLDDSGKNTMLIPLIEEPEAVDNLEEILVELKPGTDAIWFGRGDFAQCLKKLGDKKVDWDPPFVMETFKKVLKIAKQADIPVMAIPFPVLTSEEVKKTIKLGAKICLYSIEQLLFFNLCKDIVKDIKAI